MSSTQPLTTTTPLDPQASYLCRVILGIVAALGRDYIRETNSSNRLVIFHELVKDVWKFAGRSIKAPLAEQRVYPGETFVVWLEQWSSYDVLYAVSEDQLLHLTPNVYHATFELVQKNAFGDGESRRVITRTRVPRVERKVGITLALRMAGRTYPFREKRCNFRHYADYLTYGKTFGSYLTSGYWPVSTSCPVFAPLHSQTDTNSPSFKLMDSKGKLFDLGPPISPSSSLASFMYAVLDTYASFCKTVAGKCRSVSRCQWNNPQLPP